MNSKKATLRLKDTSKTIGWFISTTGSKVLTNTKNDITTITLSKGKNKVILFPKFFNYKQENLLKCTIDDAMLVIGERGKIDYTILEQATMKLFISA